jgi:dTDP-4-amino-4,6-dideoxygalactose transaminase
MAMRIGRTLPPAATPLGLMDIAFGLAALFKGEGAIEKFERELKEFYHCTYCFTVSSGKAALFLILQALKTLAPERDEVLIPAYTCYSVPSAIIRAGLKVRLCDMSPKSLDFDFDRLIDQLENPRLLCVIPTHLYGVPVDVARVKSLIGRRRIFVVEDAAQAMGAVWRGVKIGTQGDAGFFSTGRGKAFSTVEGGIIISNDDEIGMEIERGVRYFDRYGAYDRLKLFVYAFALSVLIHPLIYWLPKSIPYLKLGETLFNPSFPTRRMSSFQAGIAHGWRTRIDKMQEARLKNANRIFSCGITPPGAFDRTFPGMIRFPVLVSDTATKRKILQKGERSGLGIADGYPDSIDGIAELRNRLGGNSFPGAKEIARRLVSLPVHHYVSENDIRKIEQLVT